MILAAAPDPADHLYWLGSRAAGTAALLFASAAVFVGVLRAGGMAGGDVRGSSRRLELGILHEALGIATIVAVLIHGLVLLGDDYVGQGIADIAIPFAGDYQTAPQGIGIISGYVFMAVSLTYYLRDRIGEDRWTALHRLTLLAWVGSVVHTLWEGTDTGQAWYLVVLALPALAALAVLARRVAGGRGQRAAA